MYHFIRFTDKSYTDQNPPKTTQYVCLLIETSCLRYLLLGKTTVISLAMMVSDYMLAAIDRLKSGYMYHFGILRVLERDWKTINT